MKNILKSFVLMTAAVVALIACNKEVDVTLSPKDDALHITVKASPDAIKGDVETKTYIDGTTIKWGTGEFMKIGVFDGTATTFGDSTDETADGWNGDTEAYFNFSITPTNASGAYTYYGVYPASAAVSSSNTNPATYKVNLPATQNATATSYDPKAYILVARPESGKTEANADWEASFRRATALNHLTLKNISEDVKRVTITAPEGVYLAGARHFDLTASTMEGQNGDIYNGGGRTETIDVRFATKLTGGANMDVWFTSWDAEIPVDSKLTIVAYSDAHTFTRVITVVNKPISFKEGYLNTLNVNMSSAVQGDNTELEDGNYLILANNSGTYYALKAEAESTRMNYESYTGSLDSYAGDASIIWTVGTSDGVRTITNDSNYLGWSSGNTATLQAAGDGWTATNYGMDITWKSDHYEIAVHSDNSRILAKNTGTYGFAFYNGSGYKNIVFVPATIDNRTAVTLTFDNDQVSLTPAEAAQYLGEDLTISPNVAAVSEHLTWDYEDNDGIIDEFDNGAVTLTGDEGSATVTVSFAGDENYLPANASYTITVAAASVAEPEWVETSIGDLTTSDVFVIVGSTGPYAMSNDNGTSSAPATVSVTVSGTKLTGTIAENIKWNISGNADDGYTFYPNGDDAKWLYCTATNNGVRVGTNANKLFTLDGNGYLVNSATSRYISIYNNQDWRCYGNTSNNPQVVKFYKYVAAPDNRQEAGMSWSSDSATATYNTGNNLSFTAPTLTPGNATGITYESTDETIATINASGVVTITALSGNTVNEGSTTISAIFAGDEDYKAQTVTYTLSVVDGRTAVATPTFDPAAGEVAANTTVNFQCSDSDVTYHYTVNGSDPTVESPTAASVTIDAAKTVKVIATKTGYKPSAVATAAYTVAGVQANDGSLEHPYTADEAYAIINGYSAGSGSDGSKYVTGTVVSVTGLYNSTMLNYYISADGTATNQIQVFRGKFVANTNFSSADQVQAGDVVIVYGQLYKYNSTIEINTGNYIYSLNGITKALTAGSLSATPDHSNKQITVTWGAATGTESAISYVVTCGGQTYNASVAGSHTFTMADYGSYSISVVASATDAISATVTSSATLTDPSSGSGDSYYTLVTDPSTLSAGDKILIINTNHDALPAFTGTSTISPTDLHTSKYDSTNDRFPTNDATVDNCAITLVAPTTAVSGKAVFKLKMSNNYYLVKTATSGTGFNPATTSTAVSGDWTLSSDENGRIQIKHNLASATRGLVWRTGTTNKFAAYALSNVNNTEYYNVYIYKLN